MISFYSSLVFHNRTLFEKGHERSGSDARLDLISTCETSVVAAGVLTRIKILHNHFDKVLKDCKVPIQERYKKSGSDARLDLISTCETSVVAAGVLTRIKILCNHFELTH